VRPDPDAKSDRERSRHGRPANAGPVVEPDDDLERTIAAIWEDLLGIAPIGAEDNFYAFGGHSLMVTRLVARLRDAFATDLPLESLFEVFTVREQASVLRSVLLARLEDLDFDQAERLVSPDREGR
jgi:phthiocerol/phenolphthiocerol synthesis type-I polyketide synthase E